MSKLLKMKAWLTASETAKHLSTLFGEDVSEADVLRLALDEKLKIAFNLVNRTDVMVRKIVRIEEEDLETYETPDGVYELGSLTEIGGAYLLRLGDGDARDIRGVYAPSELFGEPEHYIYRDLQKIIGGEPVEATETRVFLLPYAGNGFDEEVYEPVEFVDEKKVGINYFIENGIPVYQTDRGHFVPQTLHEDVTLVIRTDSLLEFQQTMNRAPETKSSNFAHLSDKLAILNQAAVKWWANADRQDRGTHPDNSTVVTWLIDRGFSQTLADKAATIIRPDWAPTGRKPEE
jgi:hypothetical protein